MSNWYAEGLALYENGLLKAHVTTTPEEAQRVAAMLNERDALRAALEGVAGRRNGGPLCWCGTRCNDHADYCKRATAALEQPAAQSSERAE